MSGRLKPKISVVINNYNYAQFLSVSIDSALRQTYPRTEVVVVDDGSSDDSCEIIRSYREQVTPILKSNGGQGSAYNAGFQVSTGDIVLFLDADDLLFPEAAELIAGAWTPGVSKVHYYLQPMDRAGNYIGSKMPGVRLSSGNVVDEILQNKSYISPPGSGNAYSREFLSKVLPMPATEWVGNADCYLITYAPFFGAVLALEKLLAAYRLHGANLTGLVADGRMKPDGLRRQLRMDIKEAALLQQACRLWRRDINLESIPNKLDRYDHLKLRLASMKLDRIMHPFRQDSLHGLAWRLISSLARHRELTPAWKLGYMLWAVAVACLPTRLSETVILTAFSHRLRPSTNKNARQLA